MNEMIEIQTNAPQDESSPQLTTADRLDGRRTRIHARAGIR